LIAPTARRRSAGRTPSVSLPRSDAAVVSDPALPIRYSRWPGPSPSSRRHFRHIALFSVQSAAGRKNPSRSTSPLPKRCRPGFFPRRTVQLQISGCQRARRAAPQGRTPPRRTAIPFGHSHASFRCGVVECNDPCPLVKPFTSSTAPPASYSGDIRGTTSHPLSL